MSDEINANQKRAIAAILNKRVGDSFLYLRGAQVKPNGQAPQLKSIKADNLIIDEVDECDPIARNVANPYLHLLPASGLQPIRGVRRLAITPPSSLVAEVELVCYNLQARLVQAHKARLGHN